MKKRIAALVLTTVLLVALFGEYNGTTEQKPLRVLIDLGIGIDYRGENDDEDEYFRATVTTLTMEMQQSDYIPADTEFELLPSSGSERAMALTRLRTEMMAGSGPDVFIVGQSEATDSSNDAVFLMPEKSMALGLFYPLDDLIENNTRYMDWNDLNQTVMAAGYDEEYGQVLIPLAYEMPVTLFLASDVEHIPSTEYTWQDALNDETGILAASSRLAHTAGRCVGSEILGKLANYRTHKLTFTEEDLHQLIDEMAQLKLNTGDNTYKDMPTYCSTLTNSSLTYEYPADDKYPTYHGDFHGATKYNGSYNSYNEFLEHANRGKAERETDVTMVPAYNITGGTTATVRFFAAMNATTKRPEDAFKVIDYLLNDWCIETSEMYKYMFLNTVSVRNSVITGQVHSIDGLNLTENNAQALLRATDAITVVRFADTLEQELNYLLLMGVSDKLGALTGEYAIDLDELIHTTYTRMKRELSE